MIAAILSIVFLAASVVGALFVEVELDEREPRTVLWIFRGAYLTLFLASLALAVDAVRP